MESARLTRRSPEVSRLTNLLETVDAARHARRVGVHIISPSILVSLSVHGFIPLFVRVKVSEMEMRFRSNHFLARNNLSMRGNGLTDSHKG